MTLNLYVGTSLHHHQHQVHGCLRMKRRLDHLSKMKEKNKPLIIDNLDSFLSEEE